MKDGFFCLCIVVLAIVAFSFGYLVGDSNSLKAVGRYVGECRTSGCKCCRNCRPPKRELADDWLCPDPPGFCPEAEWKLPSQARACLTEGRGRCIFLSIDKRKGEPRFMPYLGQDD